MIFNFKAALLFTLATLCASTSVANIFECSLIRGEGIVKKNNSGCSFTEKTKSQESFVKIDGLSWTPSSENLYADLKINNIKFLKGLEFRFFSKKKEILRYSFPLFKKTNFNILQSNTTSKISFPLSSSKMLNSVENVIIDSVGVYLRSTNNHSLKIEISSFNSSSKTWKKGAVSFTFDDGYKSQLNAFKVMKKSNLAGTAFIITDAVGTNQYLSWTEIRELAQWGWDISAHHQTPITQVAKKELSTLLNNTKARIEKKGFPSIGSMTFAYPMGLVNTPALSQFKKVFSFGRLASGGSESIPISNPHKIRTFNVLETTPPEEIIRLAKKAQESGDWLVLMFHYFDQTDKGELNYSTADFKKVVAGLKGLNANIVPMSVVLKNKSSHLD